MVTATLSSMLILAGCSRPQPADIEVVVHSVGIDSVSRAPVVLLQERSGRRSLPIWIGALEAQSIAMQIDGVAAPRPLTHDLLKSIIDGVGAELDHVLISDLQGGSYHARIFLSAGGKDLDIDSRPSDAIALALRFKRPIWIDPALLRDSSGTEVRRERAGESAIKVGSITAQNLTAELAELFSISAGRGVLVADVNVAITDGLRRGDVILEVDGRPIYSVGEFHALVGVLKKGSEVRLNVQRGSDTLEVLFPAAG